MVGEENDACKDLAEMSAIFSFQIQPGRKGLWNTATQRTCGNILVVENVYLVCF
jgi:hypothetical protein